MPGEKGLADLGFWSITLGAWCYTFATTIGTALLPQMQGDLSVGLDQVTWVVTAAVVAGAIGIPPTPWLAARFGTKNLLVGSMIAFTISSALIGAAGSLEEVILWRICQAFFGAPIFVLSQSLCIGLVSYERRGTAMAIWSVALTTGWVFGPTAGAFLADWYNWRVSFFIIAPISIVATLACAVFLDRVEENRKLEFDWTGFVALSVVLLATQMVFNRGQRLDWLESQEILGWLALAALALSIYLGHTLSSRLRFIRWEVLRDWNLSYGLVLCSLMSGMSLAPLVLIPPMAHQSQGARGDHHRARVRVPRLGADRGDDAPRPAARTPRSPLALRLRIPGVRLRLPPGLRLQPGHRAVGHLPAPCLLRHRELLHVDVHLLHDVLHREGGVLRRCRDPGEPELQCGEQRRGSTAGRTAHPQPSDQHRRARHPLRGRRRAPPLCRKCRFALESTLGLVAAEARVAEQAIVIAYGNVFRLMMWLSLAAVPFLVLVPYRRPKPVATVRA